MFIKAKKIFLNSILPIISAMVVAGLAYAAWTEPVSAPPADNVAAPVNAGSVTQLKAGAFGVNGVFSAYSILKIDNNHPRLRFFESDTTDTNWQIGVHAGTLRFQTMTDNGAVNTKITAEQDGDVRIGGTQPQSPAPNGQTDNLDVNDVYLRSASQWASVSAAGKGSLVIFGGKQTPANCPAGYVEAYSGTAGAGWSDSSSSFAYTSTACFQGGISGLINNYGNCRVCVSSGGGIYEIYRGVSGATPSCLSGWTEVYSGQARAPYSDRGADKALGDMDCFQSDPGTMNNYGSCRVCVK